MKIIVTGGTGMVGSEVIRQAIADPVITEIIVLVRKAPDILDPKITTVIHNNFLDYSAVASIFDGCQACIWCLGISQTQVSKQQYEVITYEYTIAAAKAMLAANPNMRFVFVSGEGADTTEKSKTIFARVKGKTENALRQLPFSHLVIARPGGIRPIHKNKNAPFLYKLLTPLFPLMELMTPSKMINSVQLAKALLYTAKSKTDKTVLENMDLKQIASQLEEVSI